MLALMKTGPWNKPTKRPGRSVVNEEFRQYWIAQNHRYRRQRRVERLGLSALAAVGGCAAVWAFLSYGPALPSPPSLSFLSSSSSAQTTSVGPFRNCAAARAAGAAVLHGSAGNRTESAPSLRLSDADGLRASKLKHAVEGTNCDGDLSCATPIRPQAQRIPYHAFKPADGSLHQGSTAVPGCLLPAHTSMLGYALKMSITLGRSGLHHLTQHRR